MTNCPHEVEFAEKLASLDQRCKSNTHRLDEVEKRQDNLDKLAASVSLLAEREERVETDVKEIKTDVKALAEKPGKRWDAIVDKIIMLTLGAVMAYLFTKVGL